MAKYEFGGWYQNHGDWDGMRRGERPSRLIKLIHIIFVEYMFFLIKVMK